MFNQPQEKRMHIPFIFSRCLFFLKCLFNSEEQEGRSVNWQTCGLSLLGFTGSVLASRGAHAGGTCARRQAGAAAAALDQTSPQRERVRDQAHRENSSEEIDREKGEREKVWCSRLELPGRTAKRASPSRQPLATPAPPLCSSSSAGSIPPPRNEPCVLIRSPRRGIAQQHRP